MQEDNNVTRKPTEELTQNKQPARRKINIANVLLIIACSFFAFACAYRFLWPIEKNKITGMSMVPTYNEGDEVKVDKRKSTLNSLQRGDVVATKTLSTGIPYIKRVVGLPNEKITFITDEETGIVTLYLQSADEKGAPTSEDIFEESYIKEPMNKNLDDVYKDENGGPLTIISGDDEYILLGDNRNNSYDSRELGSIHISKIKGKVIAKLNQKNEK